MAYKFSSEQGTYEFRGVRDLVFAEVISDTEDEFVTGSVYKLSPVAKVTRATDNSNDAHYYDNKPMIVITSTGKDELTLTVAPMDLQTYAIITGQTFDANTGSLIEGERKSKYFAIGYITKGTDGKERYVWRLKGMFNVPDEEFNTEDDGTDTTNTEITWTGVSTIHKFVNNNHESAKAIITDERYSAVDFTSYFKEVKTPDNLKGTGVSGTAIPQIFPTSTSFSGIARISIVCDTPNCNIYYTTDGEEPTPSSNKYTEPFNITQSTIIKAYAIANALSDSPVVTKNYKLSE